MNKIDTFEVKQKQLEYKKAQYQYNIVVSMIISVVLLNLSPLFASVFSRRPPSESVLNTLNQSTLLLTGGLTAAVSFMVGDKPKKEEADSISPNHKGDPYIEDPIDPEYGNITTHEVDDKNKIET